jgi:hypothetical protein
MGVQNLLCNLPFPPYPHSSQIKCKIHIQSSLFSFIVVIIYLFLKHKIIETTSPSHTHTFVPPKVKCKIHIIFYCYPFILFIIKILTQNLYLRLIYLQFYNIIILQFASIFFYQ